MTQAAYMEYADHHLVPRTTPACCAECDDGDGVSVFPNFGLAPHHHTTHEALPPSEWPENFLTDQDCDPAETGQVTGVYTHCLSCGRPGSRYPNDLVESDGGEA